MDFFIMSIMNQYGLNDSPNYLYIFFETQKRLTDMKYFTVNALANAKGGIEQATIFMFNMLEEIIRTMLPQK